MNTPISPTERGHEWSFKSTSDKEKQNVSKDDSGDDDDDDDEVDEVEEVKEQQSPTSAAFHEIQELIKNKELKLGKSVEREKFFTKYEQHLCKLVQDDKTILHVLADSEVPQNASLKSFITQFTKKEPGLYSEFMLAKDETGSEENPLYIAIKKKKAKLAGWMCENKEDFENVKGVIQEALGMNFLPEVTRDLITKTKEETLTAQDPKGFTPLHYAVEYERCDRPSQFDIVKTLIKHGDSALDVLGYHPDYLSVFQHHARTREKYENAKTQKEPHLARRNDPQEKPHTPKPRDLAPATEVSQKGPPKDGQKENPQGKKDDANMKDNGDLKRRDSVLSPSSRVKGQRFPVSISAASKDGVGLKKKPNEDWEAIEEYGKKTTEALLLHYLRTRSPEVAADRLYGKNPHEIQICFEYFGAGPQVDPDEFEASFEHLVFENTLQYVALPNIKVRPLPALSGSSGNSPEIAGEGRSDVIFFFDWLRKKGVKRILKVIIDDLQGTAHSDEAVEKALHGFDIEILDWRKVDLCPETICTIGKELREVYLHWSGNNAVLRAWSEPDGLNKLEHLNKVHLHVNQGLETSVRTRNNTKKFGERLSGGPLTTKASPSDAEEKEKIPEETKAIVISVIEKGDRNEQLLTTDRSPIASEDKQEPTLHPHRWLECMDNFANMIQNVWSYALTQKLQWNSDLHKPVEVALIDDEVDLYHPLLRGKITAGRSLDYRGQGEHRIRPYWVSESKHGTMMAIMIHRVCPMAQIYAIKLETHYDHRDQKVKIVTKNAAEAIDAAVDRRVQIISMSWTTKQREDNDADKKKFDAAVSRAVNSGILLFCSAGDKGAHDDSDYPAASYPSKIFKIGAAKANGNIWDWVGGINNVDFIIPGHEVSENAQGDDLVRTTRPQTGSSIATALGAGLAALIISCVQLAAMHTEMSQQLSQTVGAAPTAVNMKDLADVKKHEKMKAAFSAIGTSAESEHKFIEVWKVFERAAKRIRALDKDKRLEIVADLGSRIRTPLRFDIQPPGREKTSQYWEFISYKFEV